MQVNRNEPRYAKLVAASPSEMMKPATIGDEMVMHPIGCPGSKRTALTEGEHEEPGMPVGTTGSDL